MKKYLKLTKTKRLIVLFITLLATILTISFGSIFFVSKNARKSIEYGGGAEVVLEIKSTSAKPSSIANFVTEAVQERINPLGVSGSNAETEISGDNARIRVTAPDIKSKDELEDFKDFLANKPQLVLTDFYGNPLFNNRSVFNPNLKIGLDPKGWADSVNTMESFYRVGEANPKPVESLVPISTDGAKAQSDSTGNRFVSIDLNSNAASLEWASATEYISKLPSDKRKVYAWLDPQKFVHKIKQYYTSSSIPSWNTVWNNAKSEKEGFSSLTYVYDGSKKTKTKISNMARIDDYLISEATVSKVLSGRSFIIQGNFDAAETNRLARMINYGTADYTLETQYSNLIEAKFGNSAFNKAVLAGAIVFFVIALILIVNYGLLGALSTISIALFVFLTLFFFTIMKGEYSPAAIAALIIGIGMSVDATIITFERLKTDIYSGSKIKEAFKSSNKKSFSTIFDSNTTTMIVAIVLFYFGTRQIIGLSITLIISIIFTLLVMLFFTRFIASLLIRAEVFNKKKWLAGLKPKFDQNVQKKIDKVNYIKSSKWFSLSSIGLGLAGIIVFAVFATINQSFSAGFSLSQDFSGGTSISIVPKFGEFTKTEIDDVVNALVTHQNIDLSDITSNSGAINVKTKEIIEESSLPSIVQNYNVYSSLTTTDIAQKLVRDALIAVSIAIGAIVIYTLIRFKWTYSIAAIIALLHDAALVLLSFVILRIEISPLFIAALLSIVGYSINDTIVTFDRIREKTHALNNQKLNKDKINDLANSSIRETLKRSLLTSLTTVVSVGVLMAFGNATPWRFNLAILIGLVLGTYSSIFIATYIWTKLEILRQKGVQKRIDSNFWKVDGPEEQVVQGINDYKF